jgi:type I restriction enzyme S subunit
MKLAAYSAYKDSGSQWFEEIPSHWDIKKLKFSAIVQPSNVDKKTVDGEEPVFLCNYTDVYKNEYIDSRLDFMQASATVDEIRKFLVDVGDVIVTKDSETPNDIAVPACVAEKIDGLLCGYHLTQIKPIELNGRYLFRLFQAKGFNAQFVVAANGVTRFGLPQYAIANAFTPIPSLEEQEAIARFLDFKTEKIDALIAKKQTLLEKLAEKRTALISHAVTKGLDPSVPMKDSGVEWLGKIPAHWDTKRLRFLTTMAGGMTPSTGAPDYWNGEVPWITPKDMKREVLDSSIDMLTDKAVVEGGIRLHETGRVLIVVRGMILAHTFPVAINAVPTTVNQDMKALSSSLNHDYLAFLLRGIQGLVLSIVEESAHGTKVLPTDAFKNIFLPVPPSGEQENIVREINRLTTRLDEQKRSVQSVIDRLREYRSALITNAVIGKIDVRNVPISDGAVAEV